jgi:hypothetical protein
MSESEVVTAPRRRVTWTPEERAEWVELFKRSGQSAAEFCRDNGLSPATLSFWLRQQQSPEDFSAEPIGGLVEIPLPRFPVPPSGPAVVVQLPSGARLEVSAGADVTWVGQLFRALQPVGAGV